MPLPVPTLDDKTYDDLVAEGHALIPRAFPAWTDHNESDPGVTLLELFAFLTESLLYQFDRLPDRTLVNLAGLVGVGPRPAESTGELLARAAGALSHPTAAVTADDIGTLALAGLLAVRPPLTAGLAAGTAVSQLVLAPAGALAAPSGVDTLALAGGPAVGPGEPLAMGPPTDPAFEVGTVRAAEPAGDTLSVALQAPLRFAHPAGTPVGRLAEAAGQPATRLMAAAPAGAPTVAVLPLPDRPVTGPLRFAGADGPQYAVAEPAAARAHAGARDAAAPAGGDLVRLVLVPPGPPDGAPVPADLLLQQAFELLRARMLLASRVRVVPPTYRPVRIGVTVIRDVGSMLRKDTVQAAVAAALATFLSPLRGGGAGQGWEFGRAVYRSELYGLLEGVRGVDHVAALLLDGDESVPALPLAADPALAAESLVTVDSLDVTVLDPGSGATP